jgi:hypothetical protein
VNQRLCDIKRASVRDIGSTEGEGCSLVIAVICIPNQPYVI